MQDAIRNPAFAAKLALTYADFYDGISPARQRVSLRVKGDVLELKNVQTHSDYRWHLSDVRILSDQADAESLVLAPDDEDAARLIVREVEAIRAIIDSGAPLPPLAGRRGGGLRLGIMGLIAAACFGGILFGLIPWFAEAAAERIPPEAEIALGQQRFNLAFGVTGIRQCQSPAGEAALQAMAARLTEGAELHVPLDLRVVDIPVVNAVAAAGGVVAIFSGLIDAAETPDEVAGVLAHEIGHVAHRDSTRSQIRVMGSYGLVGLLFADTFGIAATATIGQTIDASYSREAEAAADRYAHQLMARAGVAPDALGRLFARMEREYGPSPEGLSSLMSSHPAFADRIATARSASLAMGGGSGVPILDAGEWAALQSICTGGSAAAEDKD